MTDANEPTTPQVPSTPRRRDLRAREWEQTAGAEHPHEVFADLFGGDPVERAVADSQPAPAAAAASPSRASEPLSSPSTTGRGGRGGGRGASSKRSGSGRGRTMGLAALVAVAALALVGLIGSSFFGDRIAAMFGQNDYRGTGNGIEVSFAVLEGDTGTSIGERLEEAGVVKTSKAFIEEAMSRHDDPVFMPGTYRLQEEMSAESALDALLDPANRVTGTVAVPEGTAEADVYELISESTDVTADELRALAADPQSFGLPAGAKSLEGFLFPATYEFEPGTGARAMLETMVARTMQALDEHGVPEDRRWDVIRLASLVQKEAGLAADYPKVARVFLNRIDQGMPLQSDATVAYGTGNTHRVSTTDAERADESNEYNTYLHSGMVVRPISNPGDIAIDAAMHPADGQWLYFVTWNLDTGETIFSNTYQEHEQAVAKWDAWMQEHPEYS